MTKKWIFQVILALIFICHSSYRGVVEFLRDLFDYPINVATVHNRVQSVVSEAKKINKSQDLSGIKVGLKDEIFQSRLPVLAGIDAFSTYCYLLAGADHRDEDTWGCHLLDFIGINGESEVKALLVKAFESLRSKKAKSLVPQGT